MNDSDITELVIVLYHVERCEAPIRFRPFALRVVVLSSALSDITTRVIVVFDYLIEVTIQSGIAIKLRHFVSAVLLVASVGKYFSDILGVFFYVFTFWHIGN